MNESTEANMRIPSGILDKLAREEGFPTKGYRGQAELLQQKPDDFPARIITSRDELTDKIWLENEGNKRINGHPPEYVARDFGVEVDELFPPEGRSLYIGDPWQKLDRKGVVIIDYEFGEVAEFQDDRNTFLDLLNKRFYILESKLETISMQTTDPVELFLLKEITSAKALITRAQTAPLADFPGISQEFIKLQKRIEAEIKRETEGESQDPIATYDEYVRDLWYLSVHGTRALDVYDWNTQLQLPYKLFKKSLPSTLSPKERAVALHNERRSLIEGIRLKKKTEQAHVVEAMFPNLPFIEDSFDRIVAFWSISTYVFPHLSEEDMRDYWQEIYRVLKNGGKCYIAPLYYEYGVDALLSQSLENFRQQHPDFTYDLEYPERNLECLVIEKKEVK